MSDFRNQAIQDVAHFIVEDPAMVANLIKKQDIFKIDAAVRYAVIQRERVLKLEKSIQDAVLHLDTIDWPIVK